MSQNEGPDRHLLSRFWASASGFWRGKAALTSWPLTIALLIIGVSQLAVQYRLNYWNRDFFNALGMRDSDSLWRQGVLFVPLASFSVALSVISLWGRMTAQRKWRQWLTTHILDSWLTQGGYRRLESVTGEYSNAEYRIAYDVRMSTDAPVDLALGLVTSALTAFVFIDVLWNVGGSFTFAMGRVDITIPGYLVIGVVLYVALFTGTMVVIGRNLPTVIQKQTQAEAEMLAAANRIRESANHALPSENENKAVWDTFRQVMIYWRQLVWQLMGTTMVSQTDLLIAPVFAWLLCAPKYVAGTMTLGELTQASAAFVSVQVAFNWLVDNYPRMSDWRAAANRVATLLVALDKVALLDRKK